MMTTILRPKKKKLQKTMIVMVEKQQKKIQKGKKKEQIDVVDGDGEDNDNSPCPGIQLLPFCPARYAWILWLSVAENSSWKINDCS